MQPPRGWKLFPIALYQTRAGIIAPSFEGIRPHPIRLTPADGTSPVLVLL